MPHKTISFSLNGMLFEYDEEKKPTEYQKARDLVPKCGACLF